MTDQAGAGTPPRSTRRQMLAAGTGALAAVLTAGALARPAPAAAADGDNVILGTNNTETDVTLVTDSTNGSIALEGGSAGAGIGVSGVSDSGDGIYGLVGGGGNGVHGRALDNGNGVFGHANNAAASGVYGQNDGTGYGVAGRAAAGVGTLGDSADGVGVWANSDNATALKVTGKAHFSRSGILIVVAGTSSVTLQGVALTSASLVLVTLQQDRPGVWVRSAVPHASGNSFTVHLSKAVTASTKVAWFVVN